MFNRKLMTIAAGALALAAAGGAHAADLLTNGNFEASTSQTATPPGWTNIGHTDGVIAYSVFGTPAYDGAYYYDIGGYGGATPGIGDGISQTVATAIGQGYTLTFGYSGENTAGVTTVLDVLIGSMLTQFTIIGNGAGIFQKPFATTSIGYLATGTSTTISFTINSSTQVGFNDPLIDAVSFDDGLTAGVPEPASWALMLMGFAGLGVALRHSRRNAALAAI